jgi:hypothetical protein
MKAEARSSESRTRILSEVALGQRHLPRTRRRRHGRGQC